MLDRLLPPCHWDGALVQELDYLFEPEWRTAKERVALFPRHWRLGSDSSGLCLSETGTSRYEKNGCAQG
jgi:hypothetical protein